MCDYQPIDIAGERLGTVFMYRKERQYDIEDIIVSEYGTTVVGLEMMRSVNEENAEEARKVHVVKAAFSTLSFSELEAIIHISMNWTEMKESLWQVRLLTVWELHVQLL